MVFSVHDSLWMHKQYKVMICDCVSIVGVLVYVDLLQCNANLNAQRQAMNRFIKRNDKSSENRVEKKKTRKQEREKTRKRELEYD